MSLSIRLGSARKSPSARLGKVWFAFALAVCATVLALPAAGQVAASAPTGVTATAGNAQVVLDWPDSTETGHQGFNVYRGTSSPVATTGTPLNGMSLLVPSTFTDTTVQNGTIYYYVVTEVAAGVSSAPSETVSAMPDVPSPPSLSLPLRINFQSETAPIPNGYTRDFGQNYTNVRGFGWVVPGTSTPLSLVGNGRDRNRPGIDQRLDTFMHMQANDIPNFAGVRQPGAWELAVPNGEYRVVVSVGDQPSPTTSTHVINVEGIRAIDRFQSTAAQDYQQASVQANVTDGKLTVDAIGGTNTKINYLDLSSPNDAEAPAAPTHVAASAGDGQNTVTWNANSEPDLAGYNVYRSTTLPVDTTAAPLNGSTLLTANTFLDSGLTNGTTYYYVVEAVDLAGNKASALPVFATPLAETAVNIKVNFQTETAAVPTGYVRDWGQSFGPRTSPNQGTGRQYGWVTPGTTTPLSLVGNGRDRDVVADQRLDTFVHMQANDISGSFTGVKQPGAWEIGVPNGSYTVKVSVGDASAVNSVYRINIENQVAIFKFVPTVSVRFADSTRTVNVADGRLTIDALGGNNTKINYLDIVSEPTAANRPSVRSTIPANGATNVARDISVTAEVTLPNVGNGIDPATLTAATVKLLRVSSGAQVPANLNTSGGGDVIVVQPTSILAPNTEYRFEVTDGLSDFSGAPFLPFSSTFTTGTAGGPTPSPIAFEKIALPTATGKSFVSVTIGPDGKLYAGTLDGEIVRFPLNGDGTTGAPEVITALQSANGGPRMLVGLAFDPSSTPGNLILWASHSAFAFNNGPDWEGKITKLSGPNLATVQDYVVGLPRSIRDHLTNSVAFGPDGALYLHQGSNSAMGAPDDAWGDRPEHLLNAAVLRVGVGAITSPPLDVKTEEGGTYDPFAVGASLTIYASGIRNAFDLVWHSNGQLYVPTNGSAAGGNTPATPATLPAACSRRVDGATNGVYTGPQVPALSNVSTAQSDYLFRVQQGGYYGHPNASRCEWVLNGGNPTGGVDPAQVAQYPQGTQPDRNWRGPSYEFGLHYSPNGIIEYKSDVLGGALQGKLLVARYSSGDDIIVLTPGGQNLDIVEAQTGITGFTGFTDPLDLTENVANGQLYVTELGASKITLLRPIAGTSGVPNIQLGPGRLIFNDVQGGTASPTQSVTIANTGETPLTVTGLSLTGANPATFELSGTPTLPATVGPGSSFAVSVAFNPTSAGPTGAVLRVASNDPDNPQADVTLRGLGTLGLEGANEPSLQWILDTYQIPVNVGDPDPTTAALPSTPILGDEVPRQRLVAAGAGPVVFEPLAVFAPQGPSGTVIDVGDYTLGDAASRRLRFSVPNASYQALNPTVTGVLSFDPGASSFGLYSSPQSIANRHVFSEDALNTWDPTVADRHKVRFYPLKTETGSIVPDAYVVASEEIAVNFDYQDVVMIVRNVKPAPSTAPVYKVQYSTTSDRSSPVDLAGSSVAGNIYVFTMPETGVTRVRFFIDNPGMTGTPARTETVAPYDLQGTETNGTAKPLSTATFSNGDHTVTAAVDRTTGGTDVLNATFTVANAGPPDTTPPGVPAGLTATGSATGIALDWNNNTESDLAGYNVYRSASEAGTYTLLNTTGLLTSSAYNDTAAPSGATSFYRVTAVDNAPTPNESQPATASATRPPPASTYSLQYSTSPTRSSPVDLAGKTVAENIYVFTKPETGVTRVRFFVDNPSMTGTPARTEATAPHDLQGTETDGTAKPLNTRTLTNGDHTVTAAVDKSAGGTDVLNATFTIANPADTSAPAVPAGLTAVASINGIALDWADNTESDLAGYNISRSPTASGTFTPLNTTGPLTSSSYNDTGAPSGATSFYRVTAVDTATNVSDPATVSATRPTYAIQFSTSTNRTNPSDLTGRSIAGNTYIFTKPDTGITRVRFFIDNPNMTGTPALTDTVVPYDFKGTNTNGSAKPLDANTLSAGEHTITAAVDKSAGGTDVLHAKFFPWQLKAAAPLARFESRGVATGNKLYVFGGFTGTACCVATARSDVYDPATNTWTQIADMPEVLSHVGIAADGNTIWIVGGYNGPADGPATASVWKYEVTTNTWTRGPSLPQVRGAGAAAIVGRNLYFFGGINRGEAVEADKGDLYVLGLDGATAWQALAPMPNGRNHLASAVLDGKIYAIGGQHIFDEVNGNDNDVHMYDPATNQWTQLADLPAPRGHISAATLNGRVLSIGGTLPGNVHSDLVLEYDSASNTWTKLYSLPEARKSPVVGVVNGVLISSTGGNPQRSATATTWMANPSTPTAATTLLLLGAPVLLLFALRRRRNGR